MHIFVLADLLSQIEYVPQSVRASRETFLIWLRQHGEVDQVSTSPDFPPAYLFRSRWGLETTFQFREDGRLFLYLGEHRMYEAWSHSEAM